MTPSPRRVLIVEDDFAMREALELVFEAIDWSPVTAYDEEEAIRVAGKHRPHLAVVDLMLPPTRDREGIRICRWLKEHLPQTRVFVLTNRSESSVHAEAGALADRVYEKTVPLETLVEDAQAAVDGGEEA